MARHIDIDDESNTADVAVRRRNPAGRGYENISASIPKELSEQINEIVSDTKKSRSLVISELIEKGLSK